MQIDLSRTHVAMAEIRRKVWKCGHDVAFGFFQLLHRTNGKGMTKVMDPRTVSTSFMRNSTMPQRIPKSVVDCGCMITVFSGIGKEIVVTRTFRMDFLKILPVVCPQALRQRNISWLVMLCFPNLQNAVCKIYIFYTEPDCLSGTQSTADQSLIQQRKDNVRNRALPAWSQRFKVFHNTCQLIARKNVGRKVSIISR